MFKALMAVQWKSTKVAALIAVLIGFAIPVLSVSEWGRFAFLPAEFDAAAVVMSMEQFGLLYALLAAGVGLTFALLAWNPDHKGRHVYALALPVSRSRYAAMRFGAGALFLLGPAAAVLLGCLVAIAMVTIPQGLHAYPISLTIRFFLSSFVAFAIFFAIAAATHRAAAVILGSIGAVIIIGVIFTGLDVNYDLIDTMTTLLFTEPGLLSVFTGRWRLIDV